MRIKETEEAIQLLAMDSQVYGKLLTNHRKGSKVDAEVLRGRIPLRQSTGKRLQMGSHEDRNLRRRPMSLSWPRGLLPKHPWCLVVQEKSLKSFVPFGLRLVLIFCKGKNKGKTATGTWHLVNRLVQKNDIEQHNNAYKTPKMDNMIVWNNQKLQIRRRRINVVNDRLPSEVYCTWRG